MWPWGHLAVGYLCYSAAARATGRQVSALAVVALALGTQFPDLVDKPLAWTLSVLPNGRSLGHSLVVAGIVALVLLWIARTLDERTRRDRLGTDGGPEAAYRRPSSVHLASAFLLGYGSHLFADALHPLVEGEFAYLAFLGWPLLPPIEYDGPGSFAGHFAAIELTPFLFLEFVLAGLALLTWHTDGRPGIATLRRIRRR